VHEIEVQYRQQIEDEEHEIKVRLAFIFHFRVCRHGFCACIFVLSFIFMLGFGSGIQGVGPHRQQLENEDHEIKVHTSVSVFWGANLVRPGSFPRHSCRVCTAHPACQIKNCRSTRVRQS